MIFQICSECQAVQPVPSMPRWRLDGQKPVFADENLKNNACVNCGKKALKYAELFNEEAELVRAMLRRKYIFFREFDDWCQKYKDVEKPTQEMAREFVDLCRRRGLDFSWPLLEDGSFRLE